MPEITVENILAQINQLPAAERAQLLRTLEQEQQQPVNGAPTRQEQQPPPTKEPLDKRVPPHPARDHSRELRWVLAHQREYANQWLAIEGERVIAHGPNAREVYAAARADGAYLPLVMHVPDPDEPLMMFGPALILQEGQSPAQPPLVKRLPAQGVPEKSYRAMAWIAEHKCEYAGQWVALDGNRLIAHSPVAEEVFAAAKADGADRPLFHFMADRASATAISEFLK